MSEEVLLSLVKDESGHLVIHLLPDDVEAETGINPSEELLEGLVKELNPEGYHDQPGRAEVNTVVEELRRAIDIKKAERGEQRIRIPEVR